MTKIIEASKPDNSRKVRELFVTRGIDPRQSMPIHWEVHCQKTEGGARVWAAYTRPDRSQRSYVLHWSVGTSQYMVGGDADSLRENYPDLYMEIQSPAMVARMTRLLWSD